MAAWQDENTALYVGKLMESVDATVRPILKDIEDTTTDHRVKGLRFCFLIFPEDGPEGEAWPCSVGTNARICELAERLGAMVDGMNEGRIDLKPPTNQEH